MRKLEYPLYIQTLGMLFAYLALVFLLLFICFDAQSGFGWDELLKSPAGDRAEEIADTIGLHLFSSNQSDWNQVLFEFGKKYGVTFFVFDLSCTELAGAEVTLPSSVTAHMKNLLHPPPEAMRGAFAIPPPQLHPFGNSDPHSHFSVMNLLSNSWFKGAARPNELPILNALGRESFTCMSDRHRLGSSGERASLPFALTLPPPLTQINHEKFIATSNEALWIGIPISVSMVGLPFPIRAFLIAESSNIWQNKLLFDFKFMSIALFCFLLFSVVFWWPFVFNITHKLSVLTTAAEKIAEGDFTTHIEPGLNDEIGRLSDTIKSMAHRLDGFVKGQKRFLGDISHELITPLAKLDLALELFESSGAEERTSLVADINDEVREMNLMVNESLAFAQAGLQNDQPELQAVNVTSLVKDLILHLPSSNVIEVNAKSDFSALADPTSIRRAISNVLRNSVRYAAQGGSISVEIFADEQTVTIVISDRGPGVPEEILPLLGEPFFRPEFSRNRDSGGVGLGLAIVKSCIERCGGQVKLSNREGGGLQTEIRLRKTSSH